jgi:DNA-binding Lrp family transcriptional regulator
MLRLSPKEREIYFFSQLQAETPVTQIEELKDYQEHSVRYHLQSGLERKIIVPRAFINLNRLGLNQYQIYFSLSSGTKALRQSLIESLSESERVSWLGQMGGDFQYGVNLAARSVSEIAALLYQLSEEYGVLFVDKVIAERLWFKYFGNKYLSRKKRKKRELSYQITRDSYVIDELDHRILSKLTSVGVRSSRLLARELGVAQTTVDYRLRKLEQAGVILGYYYELQSALVGIQSFILLISMKSLSHETTRRLEEFCRQDPNVVILIHSFGSWEFEVGVEAEDSRFTTEIVERFYDCFGANINWIRILPAFANLKVLEYPFSNFSVFQG